MIEGQPSWKEQKPDLNPIIYKISSLESRVMELEGNYSKKNDAQILALKKEIMRLNNELKNGSVDKEIAA